MTSTAPDFTLEDTRGNKISLSAHKGRVVLVLFASQATQEASAKAASGLGKRLLQHARVDMLTAVSVPKMVKLMAMGMLRGAQDKALDGARKRFEKEGATPPADLDKRIFILPDWDGALVKQFGFDTKAKSVHLAVIGSDGALHAKLSNPDGEQLAIAGAEKAQELLG